MGGHGRTPRLAADGARRQRLLRGDWQGTDGDRWRHGAVPRAPEGLSRRSTAVWTGWFGSWVAAHWTPEDVPGLRVAITLYEAVMGGDHRQAPELRRWLDAYGITPKGQRDLRWLPPARREVMEGPADEAPPLRPLPPHIRHVSSRSDEHDDHPYAHLRVAGDGGTPG